MKKIFIINGNPRPKGATGQILTKIKTSLIEINPSIDIEYINRWIYNFVVLAFRVIKQEIVTSKMMD